ncbi:MAG: low molecular weight phosphotyrosine protein phosphatase [Bacteroidales bacterium]|nr:low molecular weight phosphotyrosine protein phosphatase [Bacteroidales bacterium]
MQEKSVLFVCLGNICRSPMAQTIFEKIVEDKGAADKFEIDSAGLGDWHTGNKADPRMRSHAEKRGYTITHRARQVQKNDFNKFDYIVGMDEQNIRELNNLATSDEHRNKILRMRDFLTQFDSDIIPDPYYGDAEDFEYVIDLLEDSCENFYDFISKES